MAEIKSFTGIIYNKDTIANLSLVIAPPYDVISPEHQDHLYEQSPYNIVRIIKGKESPEDDESDNTYVRANRYFQQWLGEGVLREEPEEAIYACQDEYRLPNGTKNVRKGFLALFRLEDFGTGTIYPHERTLAGPKEGRLRLMKACSANFSAVFSLYSDPERRVEHIMEEVCTSPPDIEILSQERILHRVWKVTDPKHCDAIVKAMAGQRIFIADGHHRYETALNYRRLMRDTQGDTGRVEPYDYCLMYFSNTDDEGLSILPYHRMINNISSDLLETLPERAKEWCDVKHISFDGIAVTEAAARKNLVRLMALMGSKRPAFGYYTGGRRYTLLVLKHHTDIDDIVPGGGSRAWKSLDVNILHSLIFERILGISAEDFERKGTLSFTPDMIKAIDCVNMKSVQAAVFVNPTGIEQVKVVALNGEKMPQKSTFFYPKIPTGLVMRRI
ncbi:MAG: DUF1015 domain-containing protein [bacterium]